MCHKKSLKPTKSASKTRSLNSVKPTTKPHLKISPVTLTVKGSGKKCERRAQAKYILPLTHRQDSQPNPLGVPAPPPLGVPAPPPPTFTPSKIIENLKSTPVIVPVYPPPNLIFLEPISETMFEKGCNDNITPLPSMQTLRPSAPYKDEPCEYYVVLKTSEDFGSSPTDNFRFRRDSGGSSGFSFRSLSSSPDSTLCSTDIDMDGRDQMEGRDQMDCTEYVKERTDIPESPTDLVPTIDQLFSRPIHDQRIDSMEQFVILEDIHQIIGESCNLISS